MSTQNPNKPSITLDGFRGIDLRFSHKDGQVAEDLLNFRIRDDGSLEKRPGFRILASMTDKIRAIYPSVLENEPVLYVLAGGTFSVVRILSGVQTILGKVSTTEGNACFFFCNSVLYLMDSKDLYVYQNESFQLAGGYVPLIGKDWSNNLVGEPYEPKNILTRRARISYVVSEELPSIFMAVGEPVESVEAVYRNGILLDPEQYYIDDKYNSINVLGTEARDRLEIYMTMKTPSEPLRSLFLTADRSILFGGTNNHRLFFWGTDDPTLIFCTSYVSAARQAASAKHNTLSNDLYVPAGYEFRLGDGGHRIRGCACHYDRLLLFTEANTWMAKPDASGLSEFSLTCINQEIGCVTPDGIASVGNHPVSLGRHAVYQWYQESDVLDRCNARIISEELGDVLYRSSYQSAGLYYNRYQNELWLFNKQSGNVWIRNLSLGGWYRYSGIYADSFFDADGRVGFVRDSTLYVFDELCDVDQPSLSDTRPVSASYLGALTGFGDDGYKNLARLKLSGDTGNGSLEFTFLTDGYVNADYPLFTDVPDVHLTLDKRISSARFRNGQILLHAPGRGRPTVHSLSLHTR